MQRLFGRPCERTCDVCDPRTSTLDKGFLNGDPRFADHFLAERLGAVKDGNGVGEMVGREVLTCCYRTNQKYEKTGISGLQSRHSAIVPVPPQAWLVSLANSVDIQPPIVLSTATW